MKKKQHLKIRNVVCIGKTYLGDTIVFWEVDSHIQYGKRFKKSKVFIFWQVFFSIFVLFLSHPCSWIDPILLLSLYNGLLWFSG